MTAVIGLAMSKASGDPRLHGQDDFIISVGQLSQNDSLDPTDLLKTDENSIVSKRSVERLYYRDRPHFFRFFVDKFHRRTSLVNRSYYLRLHLVDVTVRAFLTRSSSKAKVIVNLGCGR